MLGCRHVRMVPRPAVDGKRTVLGSCVMRDARRPVDHHVGPTRCGVGGEVLILGGHPALPLRAHGLAVALEATDEAQVAAASTNTARLRSGDASARALATPSTRSTSGTPTARQASSKCFACQS